MLKSNLILLFLLSLISSSFGATFYLNPATGLDSNPGTISQPWKSLKKVRDAGLTGANTINIVVGNYTRSQYQAAANDYPLWTQAHSKGAANNPLIIQSDPAGGGARAVFDGERDGAWVSFYPSVLTDYYIIIQNIEFKNYTSGTINIGNGGLTAPSAVKAQHLAILNNYFHDLHQGGAATTGTYIAQYIIFKGNRMVRNAIPDPFPPGTAADHVYYISHDSHHVVIDSNYGEIIGGYHVHLNSDFDNSSTTNNIIIRNNTTVNANAGSIIICCAIDRNIYVYNNTSYSEAATYSALTPTTGVTSTKGAISFHNGAWEFRDIKVKNNISVGYIDPPATGGGGLLYTDSNFGTLGAFELDYNWWSYLGGGGTQYKWLGANYASVAAFQAATTGTYATAGDHDKEGNPLFTDVAGRNFTLSSGSLAIDAGSTLTTTTAPCSASSVTVADAGYFHDGYSLIQGDIIQIAGVQRILTNVDYTTNTLTWSGGGVGCLANVPVSLRYNGANPDMGANETNISSSLPIPTNLQLITNN